MPTRREFFSQAGLLAGALALPRSQAASGSYHEKLPDMLLSYLAQKLNALSDKWDQERARIQTPAEIEARNRFVRQKFVEMLDGFPERAPLDPVVVKTLDRDGYRVENVMFQSRPNFWVTANLYVPTTSAGPFPGILSPCGHEWDGRMYRLFQLTYLDLVKNGFVVLGYDPIGQGERRNYWNPQTDKSEIGGPVTWEHSLPGQLLLLLGENLTQYRVWDGRRALDYLLSRPEVDGNRIGCTGQSGGGTFTIFLSALDDRIKCAAAHEGGTHRRWPVHLRPETILDPPDVEQNLFPAALYGVDMTDLHLAIAPRPLLATIENYSPSFQEAARQIQQRYEQLGVPEKFATEEAADPHAMTMKLRLATTNWFCRWFYNRPGPVREPDLQIEPREQLYCTPNGSIRYSRQGETLLSLMRKKQTQLPPHPDIPAGAAEIRKLLRFQKSDQPLDPRPVATTPRRGYRVEKLEFLSELGIYIPAWVFVPDARTSSRAILYVNHRGARIDGMEFGPLEGLARKGHLTAAIDVRGIGDTRPPHPDVEGFGEFRHVDSLETAMAYMAWAMDESLFGMRVQDVVRGVDYVLSRPDVEKTGVGLIGKGTGALWTLYAAALDPRIQAAVCDGGLLSYRSLTSVDRYLHGADVFIPGVLQHFDLPQVAATVADRRLAVLSPVDAMKRPVDVAVAEQVYEPARQAYAKVGAADRFRLLAPGTEGDPASRYLTLLSGV